MAKTKHQYKDLILDIAAGKKKYCVLDFNTRDEMNTGYNSIRVFIIRNDLQNTVFTVMRSNGYDNVHRVVIADTKRKDLLYQNNRICA